MVDIYRAIKSTIGRYIEAVRAQITKEELALKKDDKNERRFLLNLCVLINTIDYIKETINKMNDVIFNLIDEPYNQNLDFAEEEDRCAKVCIEIINTLVKLFDNKLETILGEQMLRVAWDKAENVTGVSAYVTALKTLLKFFADAIKENINNVYLIRCYKMLSEGTNSKFLEHVYRIKRLGPQGVHLLHADFTEIKQTLYNIGLNSSGEPISNIYNSVLEQHSEKTRNVLRVLGMPTEQVGDAIRETLSTLSAGELTKLLTLKGMKKAEINGVLEKARIA